jgi:hypothetical protein
MCGMGKKFEAVTTYTCPHGKVTVAVNEDGDMRFKECDDCKTEKVRLPSRRG